MIWAGGFYAVIGRLFGRKDEIGIVIPTGCRVSIITKNALLRKESPSGMKEDP
jgi:hypothetical protein